MSLFGLGASKKDLPTPEQLRNIGKEQDLPRYKVNYDKLIQAIHVAATAQPNITHYYLGKALFKADREHVIDYGRPITGCTYLAFQFGPYAEEAIELVKGGAFVPPEIQSSLDREVETLELNRRTYIKPRGEMDYTLLSEEEIDYIRAAVADLRGKDFGRIADETHEDVAWKEARDRGDRSTMDVRRWLSDLENPEKAAEQLTESAHFWA